MVNIMSCHIADWSFNGLQDGEAIADISQAVFVRSNNEAFKRMNTHTHTHTHTYTHTHTQAHTYGYTLRECNALHFAKLTESPHATLYLLVIAMFALSVTVCEIIDSGIRYELDLEL